MLRMKNKQVPVAGDTDPILQELDIALEQIYKTSPTESMVSLSNTIGDRENFPPDLENEFPRTPPPTPNMSAVEKDRKRRPNRLSQSSTRIKSTIVLLTTALGVNVCVLIVLGAKSKLEVGTTLTAVSANIVAAVLIRQEHILNMLYDVFTRVSPHAPLFMRKHLADFHHYGGVHTGCAISSLAWYIAYMVLGTEDALATFKEGNAHVGIKIADLSVCYFFLILLVLVCVTAWSSMRRRYHNIFELTHRFGSWLALIVLWTHTILISAADNTLNNRTAIPSLLLQPSLYLLAITTVLIISPWLRIRRVSIYAERLSSREISLVFEYESMPPICTMRFSNSPLFEWHAFATIPLPNRRAARIVIADAGDWTRDIISSAPTHIWLRTPPLKNFLYAARMFRRILLVATGAGIGPVLSYLASLSPDSIRHNTVKILWCANNPFTSPWRFAVDAIRSVDPSPMIIDTRQGRPDLGTGVKGLAKEYSVEAVFVVSNKTLTDRVVRSLKESGVPGYGAVFDS